MSKVVIDTNILYSLIGLSENPKVTSSNIKDFKLSITTSSLMEAIVKYHNDLKSIKLCIEPILKEEIELISIGHTPISNQYLMMLYLADTLENVSHIINDIKTLKIFKEAEFYRFILIIVMSGLFEVIKEDGYKFDNEHQDQAQLALVKALLEPNMDLFLDFFRQEIRMGYENGNEQQAALDAFQSKIIWLLGIFHFGYHMIKTNCFPGKEHIGEIAALSKSMDDDNFHKKFKKYIESPISYASRGKYKFSIDNYLNLIKDGVSNLNGFTEQSLQFLLNKIERAYKEKSKIRKNDIFDSLIVNALSMENTRIVTLDKGFLKDLKEIDPSSYQLCQDLGYLS